MSTRKVTRMAWSRLYFKTCLLKILIGDEATFFYRISWSYRRLFTSRGWVNSLSYDAIDSQRFWLFTNYSTWYCGAGVRLWKNKSQSGGHSNDRHKRDNCSTNGKSCFPLIAGQNGRVVRSLRNRTRDRCRRENGDLVHIHCHLVELEHKADQSPVFTTLLWRYVRNAYFLVIVVGTDC